MSFDTLKLHPNLVRAVQRLGFTEATPIQLDAIPPALEGRDLLACAMTGSGKTAAFGLPTLQRLQNGRKGGPRALVLTPTRELAAQVSSDIGDLAFHTRLRSAAVFGGVAMGPQLRAFQNGVEVLVATPGRLLDHLGRRKGLLNRIEVLILDEADRMLDMGFLPDIRRILRMVPERRQTFLFSATMPAPIARLAREMLYDPVQIAIERRSAPAEGIRHKVFPVAQQGKSKLLLDIMKAPDVRSVLAFTRTKSRANRLAEFLTRNGVAAAKLHGNRSQGQREKALAAFKNGRARVLVATDIAARGIDVEDLSHVVNYDVPRVAEDYIHRVGRTARANREGDAFTFVSPDEEAGLRSIEKSLGKGLDRAAPVGGAPVRSSGGPGRGSRRPPASRRGPSGRRPAGRRRSSGKRSA